jgi:hypothetical protein
VFREVTIGSLHFWDLAFRKTTLQKKIRAIFQKIRNSVNWYATTFKLGNYVTNSLIKIWLAGTCKTFSLGRVTFELGVRKLVAVQSCRRRRKTGALTSRNPHWNIALAAQDKAIRLYKSESHDLINGLICNIYCHVHVTVDGVWIGEWIYWPLLHPRLVTTIYRSLSSHTDYCPQPITVSTNRFLATDFNTGTITISLNYTLKISHTQFSPAGLSTEHSWN